MWDMVLVGLGRVEVTESGERDEQKTEEKNECEFPQRTTGTVRRTTTTTTSAKENWGRGMKSTWE